MNRSIDAPFWETKALHELSDAQWESLCDGCGKCCLHKLEDEDTGEIAFTRVACRLLDFSTGRCSDYANRCSVIPDCLDLRRLDPAHFHWLPDTCAYRRVNAGQPLPHWHPLISGESAWLRAPEQTIRDWALSEETVDPDAIDVEHIRWINRLE